MSGKKEMTRKDFLKGCGIAAAGCLVGGEANRAAGAAPPETTHQPLPFSIEQVGTLDPSMRRLLGVAFDAQDRLYAAGAPGIRIFGANREPIAEIETSGPVCCVDVDAQGFVYAGMRAKIEKFDPDGRQVAAWGDRGRGPGQFSFLTSLAVDGSFLYIADSGGRCIHRYAVNGDYVDAIREYQIPQGNPECAAPDVAPEEEGFLIPSGYFDCVVDEEGMLHVGHTGRHRVERYDRNGKSVGHWGRFGPRREDFCGCCNPTNLALFPDGRVATTEKGVPRLKVYDSNGRLLAYLGEDAFPGNAAGMALAIDSRGRIALVEPVHRKIRFYELIPSEGSPSA